MGTSHLQSQIFIQAAPWQSSGFVEQIAAPKVACPQQNCSISTKSMGNELTARQNLGAKILPQSLSMSCHGKSSQSPGQCLLYHLLDSSFKIFDLLTLDFMCLFHKFCALSPFVLGLLLKFSVWSKGIPTGLATTSTQPSLEAPSIARFTVEASNQKTRFSSRLSWRIQPAMSGHVGGQPWNRHFSSWFFPASW